MTTQTYTLITGASSGIGKEFASIAANEGRNLVLVARNKSALSELASELTTQYAVSVEIIAQDLSEQTAPHTIFDTLQDKQILVDTLINNAGFGDYGSFDNADSKIQLNMINLNIRSLTELTQLFLPEMKQRGHGFIMNLGSVASFVPGPLMSVYFASKAYVLSFSEALSEELRGSGVSVTCLCPGSTNTNFGNAAHVSETHSTRTSHVTAKQVAEYGWKAMNARKAVAVYGFSNRSALFFVKFLPRNVVRKIVARIQR